MKHFKTYVRINSQLTEMVRKVFGWLSFESENLIVIESYTDLIEDAEIRTMRLFSTLGASLLIQDHRTIEVGIGDEAAVLVALKIR